MIVMDECVEIPHYATSEPSEGVATQLTTPRTTRKYVALADVDTNRSTEDKPTVRPKEKKQSKKQKETSRRRKQEGKDKIQPTGELLDLAEFNVEQATTLADETCKDMK